MSTIDKRIAELGLVLPKIFPVPEAMSDYMAMVRIDSDRCYISGHAPLNPDGSIALPLGKVGAELTLEQGVAAAKATALSMLATLKNELGSLDRIKQWNRVFGMVNSAPGFNQQTPVINGFSEVISDVFGHDAGKHARSAVGMAELPFSIPVEVEAEISLH
jgi:enamine deaminase RidA (YjgF/YER057c/UK114 family)